MALGFCVLVAGTDTSDLPSCPEPEQQINRTGFARTVLYQGTLSETWLPSQWRAEFLASVRRASGRVVTVSFGVGEAAPLLSNG